jgi:divalent metal cation (Fe/Co/Zn/Cd) transporter
MMADKIKLYKWASFLAYFTIGYNIIEGVVSVFFGYSDETLTLFGFGVDSFIEVISGIGIAHMINRIKNNGNETNGDFENRALRITGYSFFVLSVGLTITASYNIYIGHKPETTIWGVIISAISILFMFFLIKAKTKVGNKLGSAAIIADANCSKICLYMSAILLFSSGLFELTHIPFIDVVGTAGIIWLSVKEGLECFEKIKNNGHCGSNSCGCNDH